jgi:hypothetical protein
MDKSAEDRKITSILMELRPLIKEQIMNHPEHGSVQFEITFRSGVIQRLLVKKEKSIVFGEQER